MNERPTVADDPKLLDALGKLVELSTNLRPAEYLDWRFFWAGFPPAADDVSSDAHGEHFNPTALWN